jgi:hypothetical protein
MRKLHDAILNDLQSVWKWLLGNGGIYDETVGLI